MAYQRTEYHRDVQRDSDDRDNKGGWRSWFGLDNKDRDDETRGYNYQSTTTYRNPQSSYERTERSPYAYGGYSGGRGGYGYTTSDEVTRGPSWTTDRDYTTRPSYGQPTGDRDVYYRQETRTYGGDRGDYTGRSYTPSRSYGYGYERDYPTRDYPSYPTYPTTTYPYRGYTSEYPTSRGYTTDYPTPSRGYTTDYPTPSRGYPTTYDRDYTTPSRGYGFSGDRDYPTSSRYPTTGYRGDYSRDYTGETSYTRPSYQPTSYRY